MNCFEKGYCTRRNGGIVIGEDIRAKVLSELLNSSSSNQIHCQGREYSYGSGKSVVDCLGHGFILRANDKDGLKELADQLGLPSE